LIFVSTQAALYKTHRPKTLIKYPNVNKTIILSRWHLACLAEWIVFYYKW